MDRRGWIVAAAVAGAVALGSVLGATVFAPAIGAASDDDERPPHHELCLAFGTFREGPIATAAEEIGITAVELLRELREGRTIAEVAEEHGVDPAEVTEAVLDGVRARLDAAVDDGRLRRELADRIASHLEEHVDALVRGELPAFPRFGHGGPHLGWGHGPFGRGGWHVETSVS